MDPRAPDLIRAACLVPLLVAAAWPLAARAGTQGCMVIDTLPADLTVPGHYCLAEDFVQDFGDSKAIAINADDIVLDCNDHAIRTTRDASSAYGIAAPSARRNVEVRNCEVENFFWGVFFNGIAEPGSVGNRIVGNSVLRAYAVGIEVTGSNNLIEGNRVVQLRGDLFGRGSGIKVHSPSWQGVANIIRGNQIGDFRPESERGDNIQGIYFYGVRDTEVSGNTITGLYTISGWGTYGIRGSDTSNNLIVGNTVLSPSPLPWPLSGAHRYGILLSGTAEEQATNACRDNVVGRFLTNITGCVKDANTEF